MLEMSKKTILIINKQGFWTSSSSGWLQEEVCCELKDLNNIGDNHLLCRERDGYKIFRPFSDTPQPTYRCCPERDVLAAASSRQRRALFHTI